MTQIRTALDAAPPDPLEVFRIGFMGAKDESAPDPSSDAPHPRMRPHVAIIMALWQKIDEHVVDRRLVGLHMHKEKLAEYLANAPAAVASKQATRKENFYDTALPEAAKILRRDGQKWGEADGLDPVKHILEPMWRYEHSLDSARQLLASGESGYDRPDLMLEAVPMLQQFWASLGMDPHHDMSFPKVVEVTCTIMKKYSKLSDDIKKPLFKAGKARMRCALSYIGSQYHTFRAGGNLDATAPSIAVNRASRAEADWTLLVDNTRKMEDEHATDRALNRPSRTSLRNSIDELQNKIKALESKKTKRLRDEDDDAGRSRKDKSKGKDGEPPKKPEKPPALENGEFSENDYYQLHRNNRGDHHLLRYSPEDQPLCAVAVDLPGVKDALSGSGLCPYFATFGGKRDKNKMFVGCSDECKEVKQGTGVHARPPKAFKRDRYYDKGKRIVKAATILFLSKGARVTGEPTAAMQQSQIAAPTVTAHERAISFLASETFNNTGPVTMSPFASLLDDTHDAKEFDVEAMAEHSDSESICAIEATPAVDGAQARSVFSRQIAGAIAAAKKTDDDAGKSRIPLLRNAAKIAGFTAAHPHTFALLDLFSGPYERADSIANCARAMGWSVFQADNDEKHGGGWKHDIMNDVFFQELLTAAKEGSFDGVMVALPCAPYSAARFYQVKATKGKPGPPPLYTTDHPEGKPLELLTAEDADTLQYSKELRRRTFLIASSARQSASNATIIFETPVDRSEGKYAQRARTTRKHSTVLKTADFAQFVSELGETRSVTFSQCRLGGTFEKDTTLVYTIDAHAILHALAQDLHKCNHPRKAHQVAGGRNDDGSWASTSAAAYPFEMNVWLTSAFTNR